LHLITQGQLQKVVISHLFEAKDFLNKILSQSTENIFTQFFISGEVKVKAFEEI